MKTFTLIVFSAVVLIGSVRGQIKEDPGDLWMTGFLQIQGAVNAEKIKNSSLAIGRFQQALWIYNDIAQRFPAFESARRTERIRLLSAKIKSLGGIPIVFETSARAQTVIAINSQPVPAPAKLPAMPSSWVAGQGGGVVLPAVITPETRAYSKAIQQWWVDNGSRYSNKLILSK